MSVTTHIYQSAWRHIQEHLDFKSFAMETTYSKPSTESYSLSQLTPIHIHETYFPKIQCIMKVPFRP
jgi:hypothetical protein